MSCFLQITVLFYTNVISICNCSFWLPFIKLIAYILNQNNLDTMPYIQCYNVLSFKVLVSFEHVKLCNQSFQIQARLPYWSLSYSNVVNIEILILEVLPIWIPHIWIFQVLIVFGCLRFSHSRLSHSRLSHSRLSH